MWDRYFGNRRSFGEVHKMNAETNSIVKFILSHLRAIILSTHERSDFSKPSEAECTKLKHSPVSVSF